MTEHGFDDRRMETIMGRLLQAGVLLASAVVLAGGLLYCKRYPGGIVSYRAFVSKPLDLLYPGEFLRKVAGGDAAAWIMLGILLLLATPIARVVFAVVAFAVERDRLYVVISLVVLAVLMFGLFHGA
jgi:uncharacterized membrane protein